VLEDHGTYYMYFSAESGKRDGMCVGVATSKSPRGPFVDSGKPLVCGGGFANIDPCPFDDPKSGKKLLYWGSGFEPIRVRELGGDRLSFAPGSRETAVLWPSRDPYEALIEGAWVAYRDGFYYLFYSGDNCCGDQASYAVAVARSESPLGPFIKRNYMNGGPNSAILQGNARWRAPGHNAVVKDGKGQEWIVYHAIDLKQPYLPGSKTTRRPLLIDRLLYRNGWPEVPGGTPSTAKQSAPTP
jgi:arabinan endo-1,5-alpha-L-arabinosidase